MKNKQLVKSNDHIFLGVLGGIAEYFNWDKAITRIIGAILIIFPGQFFFGIITYFVAAAVMPDKNDRDADNDIIEGEFRDKKSK
ncbi:PspC domain-containing protein [Liquorilactobacillus cacaonum]|uniref:Phage shock protein PspC N-terminal domain-containing protein n=1 Tax=Liquorilactobacillus cacaonum DSM 21116 TaxID=1423729 RepID=A0A0R2CG33_9LACO|nr:PspC domain-containing protein [Liquorilactobacillus cacaonum]KRM90277.1 hypothetical protein FC80_GL001178 [Liquorilactobacillus cacaonum DSM 21116]